MKNGPVYLHLSRGNKEPRVTSTDYQSGPIFGPYRVIRFGDDRAIYMEKENSDSDVLHVSSHGVFYDGMHYAEWSVSSIPESIVTAYNFTRIEPPRLARSDMSLEERFRQLVLLCECVVEERLSILREDDPEKREFLLTSDIDDQIGHWRFVEKEVMELK